MLKKGLLAQRLVGWFLLAVSLLNFPLLLLWDHNVTLWGIPIFPLGLFIVWTLLILGLVWIIERTPDEE
ncbi:hypothetical protein [Thiofilum flexile]|uniref:hypothetical protein n=1 Tax=Thiofilum flexile TaxID=125627 RepID=UPI000369F660|nr:hypothetical protein [Thiofilum flexile]